MIFNRRRDAVKRDSARVSASCSFCAYHCSAGGPLIEGPSDFFICRHCIEEALRHPLVKHDARGLTLGTEANPYAPPQIVICSVCETSMEDDLGLRSSIDAKAICSDCIEVCAEILDTHRDK